MVELAERAIVHPQPIVMAERVAVAALHRRAGRRPNVGEEQRSTYLTSNLPQVDVIPRRLNALEDCRFGALSVPADPEAVTVGRCGAHPGVQALVDDRMSRAEQQLFGEDRGS